MRKKVFGYQLDRTSNQRKALFRGLISALIKNGEITTTFVKAKAIKGQAEKLITKAKIDSVANQRQVFKTLNNRDLVNRLFKEIAPKFKERKGGYLRVLSLGLRKGDGAKMARILFTGEVFKASPMIKDKKTEKPAEIEEKTADDKSN